MMYEEIEYSPVPSAKWVLKAVWLLFTATKDGLWYAKGYLGTEVQVFVEQEDETSHRSEDPVSNATRKLITPVRMTA